MTTIITKISPAKVPPITTAKSLSVRFPTVMPEDLVVTGSLSVVMTSFGSMKVVVVALVGVAESVVIIFICVMNLSAIKHSACALMMYIMYAM